MSSAQPRRRQDDAQSSVKQWYMTLNQTASDVKAKACAAGIKLSAAAMYCKVWKVVQKVSVIFS